MFMNIGIVIPGFSSSEQDWCIPVYLNLARALAQTDSVRVIAMRYPRRSKYKVYGAQVYALGGGSHTAGIGRGILIARTIALIIRQHLWRRFDVLHAIWADETGFAACMAGRLLGVPVVVSTAGGELVHFPGYGLQGGRISPKLVEQALLGADRITAPCEYAADIVRQATLYPERIQVVPLGVDTALFAPPFTNHRAEDRLLAVGSLISVKGHDQLIEALAYLPGVALDVVGEGPLLDSLCAQAEALGVADRVVFHGAVAHDALPRYYQSAALHVLTSQHEAFGMVVAEAAACGLPTVGYGVGVLPEFARQADAGIVVASGDIQALAWSIRLLLSHADRRQWMGNAARQLVESRYSVDVMAAGFRAVYRELCGR